MSRKMNLTTLKAALGRLERSDLIVVQAEVERLLAQAAAAPTLNSTKRLRRAKRPSTGTHWIEYKRIRGYGPYAYLRTVESDGRVSSHYLGKSTLAANGGQGSEKRST